MKTHALQKICQNDMFGKYCEAGRNTIVADDVPGNTLTTEEKNQENAK